MTERGDTTNKARAAQARDFTGLQYGKITPTDIDGLIEYKDKAYILLEAKYEDAPTPYGQKLALERMCDDLQKTKPTLLIFAKHHNPVNQAIDFAKCQVEQFRYRGTYRQFKHTVRQLIDQFIKSLETQGGQS